MKLKYKFIILLYLLLMAGAAYCEDAARSVYRISSQISGSCATAFQLEPGNIIVTNFHVAESICKQRRCEQVLLERGLSVNTEPEKGELYSLEIAELLPALDVAVFKVSGLKGNGLKRSLSSAKVGLEVEMLGFPSCGPLKQNMGRIIEAGITTLRTTAEGASGSSGSPMLATNGEVVAIANESDSFWDAALDKTWSKRFNLRAAPAEQVWKSEGLNFTEAVLAQSKLLIDVYKQEVLPATGMTRIRRAINYINSSSRIKRSIIEHVTDAEIQLTASFLEQPARTIVDSALTPPASEAAKMLEQVIFAANLESRGTASAPSADEITTSKRTAEQSLALAEILRSLKETNYPGLMALGVITSAPLLIVSLLIVIFYGWSLGMLFAKARGNILVRCIKMLALGIIAWPIGIIAVVAIATLF